MAGQKVAGVDVLLSVTVDAVKKVIGGQSGATINFETNLVETTSKDDNQWASSVPGVRSWNIECEGFYVADDLAQAELESIWLSNGTLDAEINFPSGKKYAGKVLIESQSFEMPQDDAVSFSTSFTGTGPLTITPSP
jgi:TP901-1 family phage major tail protein